MLRNFITVLVATLLWFVWGGISWMQTPLHKNTESFKDPEAVARVLKENAPKAGVYELPSRDLSQEEWQAQYDKGPFLQGMVRVKPTTSKMGTSLAGSAFISFLSVLLIVYVLFLGRVNSKEHRVLVALAMGLFTVVVDWLPAMNWFGYPMSYVLPYALDAIVGSLVAGLVIAFGITRFYGPGAD